MNKSFLFFSVITLIVGYVLISCQSDQPQKKDPSDDKDPTVSHTIEGSFEEKFARYVEYQKFAGAPQKTWDETAWKGERVYKQVVLWSSKKIEGLQYDVSDLTGNRGSVSASSIKLLFGKYIKGDPEARHCSQYTTHPEAVHLIDALSTTKLTTLESNDPIKMWVVIDVPASTIPGSYTGNISVSGSGGEITFSIRLKVLDRTLPPVGEWDFHLDLWQFPINILNIVNSHSAGSKIGIWSDEHFALLEPSYKMLSNSGQKVITTYIMDGALGGESMVKWIKKSNGTWEYDFAAFDKYVATLMSWGITKQISCFSPYGWHGGRIAYWDESKNQKIHLNTTLGSKEYSERWDHFLTEFKAHLKSHGWFDKAVLYLDEISEEKLNQIISVVHGNDPAWKLGIAYNSNLSNEIKSHFYDLSGILVRASNNGIADENISTFYTCCDPLVPNGFVTPKNSTAEMTWMAWHALSGNYGGYLNWAYDYWRLDDPFDARDELHTAGDFSFVYRDSNTPPINYLPSLRLEMLRDGIQDFEKVRILRQGLGSSQDPGDIQKMYLLESYIILL